MSNPPYLIKAAVRLWLAPPPGEWPRPRGTGPAPFLQTWLRLRVLMYAVDALEVLEQPFLRRGRWVGAQWKHAPVRVAAVTSFHGTTTQEVRLDTHAHHKSAKKKKTSRVLVK